MKIKKTIITPQKPIFIESGFNCLIKLNKNQIDYSNLSSKKELIGFKEQYFRHITIIGDRPYKKIQKALNKFSTTERKKKILKIKSILKKLKWQYIQKDFYLINKKGYFGETQILENRFAYIRVIEMPDMNIFYNELNLLLKIRIPIQFPHITLFTKGEHPNRKYFGIPINSKVEFKKLNPKRIT